MVTAELWVSLAQAWGYGAGLHENAAGWLAQFSALNPDSVSGQLLTRVSLVADSFRVVRKLTESTRTS